MYPNWEYEMSTRTITVDERLYAYMLDGGVREQAILRELREATADHEWAVMQISPEQGQLMQMLVQAILPGPQPESRCTTLQSKPQTALMCPWRSTVAKCSSLSTRPR